MFLIFIKKNNNNIVTARLLQGLGEYYEAIVLFIVYLVVQILVNVDFCMKIMIL